MAIFSADSILNAFLLHSAQGRSFVSFAERSAPHGYVRVYGPGASPTKSATCHVVIERPNGAVSVTKELQPYLPVVERPDPACSIVADPGGFASGPQYGRYGWTVVTDAIDSPDALVDAILGAFQKAHLPW